MTLKYKKMVRHKRKPRQETSSFSKNSEKVVFTAKDGSYMSQSHLSGKYIHYNKKGKEIKR